VVVDVEPLQSHRVAVVRTEALLESRGGIPGWLPHFLQRARVPWPGPVDVHGRSCDAWYLRRLTSPASPVCVTGLVFIWAPDGCSGIRIVGVLLALVLALLTLTLRLLVPCRLLEDSVAVSRAIQWASTPCHQTLLRALHAELAWRLLQRRATTVLLPMDVERM